MDTENLKERITEVVGRAIADMWDEIGIDGQDYYEVTGVSVDDFPDLHQAGVELEISGDLVHELTFNIQLSAFELNGDPI